MGRAKCILLQSQRIQLLSGAAAGSLLAQPLQAQPLPVPAPGTVVTSVPPQMRQERPLDEGTQDVITP